MALRFLKEEPLDFIVAIGSKLGTHVAPHVTI